MFVEIFKFIIFNIFRYRPVKHVKMLNEKSTDTTELIVVSVKGFQTTFKCQKMTYKAVYESRLIPDEYFIVYKLSAVHSEDIPDNLRSVLSAVHYLPSFSRFYITEEDRRTMLLEAYVDLVSSELDQNQK